MIKELFRNRSLEAIATASSSNNNDDGLWSQSLLLSVLAGASTCLGAAVVLIRPRHAGPLRKVHLAAALSLAGSVMMTVSIFSLLPEALEGVEGLDKQLFERLASFVVGAVLYALLSKCAFPEPEAILGFDQGDEEGVPLMQIQETRSKTKNNKPSLLRIRSQASSSSASGKGKDEEKGVNVAATTVSSSPMNATSSSQTDRSLSAKNASAININDKSASSSFSFSSWLPLFTSGQDLATNDARRAWRVAWLLFISLCVHNFPEGLAVAASSMHSPHLGITTAVAIALHNIPEGIAIAIPCLAARPDSPCLAFGLASLSGLTEPLGALVALTVLQVNQESMGNWLAFVASIMMAVAVMELFPEAWRNAVADEAKSGFWMGTVAGFVIMVGSDAILDQSLEEE